MARTSSQESIWRGKSWLVDQFIAFNGLAQYRALTHEMLLPNEFGKCLGAHTFG